MQAADVWGIGALLFYMIFGEFPFDSPNGGVSDDNIQALKKVGALLVHFLESETLCLQKVTTTQQLNILPGAGISNECKTLIIHMLQHDIDQRPTLESVMKSVGMSNAAPIPENEEDGAVAQVLGMSLSFTLIQ